MKHFFSRMMRLFLLAVFACGVFVSQAQETQEFFLQFDDEGDSQKREFIANVASSIHASYYNAGIEVSLNRDFTDAKKLQNVQVWQDPTKSVRFRFATSDFPCTVYYRIQTPLLHIELDSVVYETSTDASTPGRVSAAMLKGYKPLCFDYSIGINGDTIPVSYHFFQHKNRIPYTHYISIKNWAGPDIYDRQPLTVYGKPGDKIEFDVTPVLGQICSIFGEIGNGFDPNPLNHIYEQACVPYHTVYTISESEKADTLRLDYRQAKKLHLFLKDEQGNYVKVGGNSKMELKNGLAYECEGMDFYVGRRTIKQLYHNDSLFTDTICYGGFLIGAKEVPGIGTDPSLTGCEVYAFPGKYTVYTNPKSLNTDNMVPFSIEVKDNDEQVQQCILNAATTFPFDVRVKGAGKYDLLLQALSSNAAATESWEEQCDEDEALFYVGLGSFDARRLQQR